MAQDNFYQRLEFYNWLLNRPEGSTFIDFGELHDLSTSTLARWNARFDHDVFIRIIAKQAASKTIRDQIIKAIQTEALSGNIQAAKIVLAEVELSSDPESGDSDILTVDQAIKIIREAIQEVTHEKTNPGGAL